MEQCFLRARKLDSKLARCRALFITFVPCRCDRVLDHREKKYLGTEDRGAYSSSFDACLMIYRLSDSRHPQKVRFTIDNYALHDGG